MQPPGEILSPRVFERIQNDECECSHGRARNKAVGENVGELFAASTRAEINDEREQERKRKRERERKGEIYGWKG